MSISFCSFASGSSGNCYLIRKGETAILIDAGISGRRILKGLEETETPLEQVKAVLVTHEHIDHVRSLKTLCKKLPRAMIFTNIGTWERIKELVPPEKHLLFQTGDRFQIGDIGVQTFSISHDAAEPVGYSMSSQGKTISVVTDTGYVTEEIYESIKDSDILAIEANHDENMLMVGRYPWNVKQRILGEKGHLSNTAAGKVLCRLLKERKTKPRCFLLAHLSGENNFPEMAYETVKNILAEADFYLGPEIRVKTMGKDEISDVYEA